MMSSILYIENGFQLVVWVGQQVSHDFTSQVFGAPSVAQINTDIVSQVFLDLVIIGLKCSVRVNFLKSINWI